MDPAVYNMNKKITRAEKWAKVFRGVIYSFIVIIVLLFLIFGSPWIFNRSYYNGGGGGMVVAVAYVGPVILLDVVATIYFIVTSIFLGITKANHDFTRLERRKCRKIFWILILVSVLAIAVIF